MATSMLVQEETENKIREGFICPICMEDLVTVDFLLEHFEVAHDTEEDKDILKSFKGEFCSVCLSITSFRVVAFSLMCILLCVKLN